MSTKHTELNKLTDANKLDVLSVSMERQARHLKIAYVENVYNSVQPLIEVVQNLIQKIEKNQQAIQVLAAAVDRKFRGVFEDDIAVQVERVYKST